MCCLSKYSSHLLIACRSPSLTRSQQYEKQIEHKRLADEFPRSMQPCINIYIYIDVKTKRLERKQKQKQKPHGLDLVDLGEDWIRWSTQLNNFLVWKSAVSLKELRLAEPRITTLWHNMLIFKIPLQNSTITFEEERITYNNYCFSFAEFKFQLSLFTFFFF